MNLIGQKVNHIMPNGKPGKYGSGIIVKPQTTDEGNQIIVKFDSEETTKKFLYPECFGRYLVLCNSELAKEIEAVQKAYCNKRAKHNGREVLTDKGKKTTESTEIILHELDRMIGLNTVKQEVHTLSSFIQVNNLRKAHKLKSSNISKHLVLTGNPGTGKTTVARMIAQIYYSIGAIKSNKFVETNRAGLVAGYVGQTALKTQDVIKSALGGVLFIDEAYSLANGSGNDFGKEAIDVLLSAMENNRDDLVVIVAGYEDRMKQFLNMNPGLSSRFNRYIHFEDYNSEQLMSIFLLLCEKNEYTLQKESVKRIEDYIHIICNHRDKKFGNARFIRNLFETIIAHQAERISHLSTIYDDTLMELTISDVENAIKNLKNPYVHNVNWHRPPSNVVTGSHALFISRLSDESL